MNIFTKQTWFTCTSITSRKIITLKISPVLKLLAKDSHTEPIFCFDWIPIVVFDNPEEDDCSNTVDASSARLDSATVHNTPHKMTFLYRYSLRKNHLGGQTYKKPRRIKDFSFLNYEKSPLLSSTDRRQDRRNTY